MATASGTFDYSHTSDATFRVWATAVHTIITTFLTDTAATGSVNLATMTRPGTNTFAGFKVYRFNDTLQGTSPGFLKVEYGTGVVAGNAQLRISAGTAHDGAGTLTGTQVFSATTFAEVGSVATLQYYASGDSSRLVMACGLQNTGTSTDWVLCFERTKDSTGADDSTGLVLALAGRGGNANVYRSAVIPPSGGVPPVETRLMFPFARLGSAVYNSKCAMALMIPFAGEALRPIMGLGFMNATDYPVYGNTISVTVYGAAHDYLAIGSGSQPNAAVDGVVTNAQNTGRMLIRYE